ncbi:MAG TPA: helix-turn-helix domain-containing protein [Actinomycetota bacterium]|nr:helix-turn-helix domain-containing protein [Actinomycetota bacterium]
MSQGTIPDRSYSQSVKHVTNGLDAPGKAHVVAAVIDQGLLTFDFAIACEVFGLDRSDIASPWYDFRVVSASPPPLRTSTGFSIIDVDTLDAASDADTVIIPGWSDPSHTPDPAVGELLRERHARGARVVAFCTGTFALAASGLLDGRRATTHWMYADELHKHFPKIELDPSVLFVEDERVFTAAGTAAGMDLSLHLVAQDYGQGVANSVARRIVLPPLRQGGQAQYIEYDLPRNRSSLGPLLEWIEDNLDQDLDLDTLARRGHMSVRTLTRRFRDELGMPPKRWLLTRRVVRARELLEMTALPVAAIATRCGFPSSSSLRSHFFELFLTTPSEYRNTFQAS